MTQCFSKVSNVANPLSYIAKEYKMALLQNCLTALLKTPIKSDGASGDEAQVGLFEKGEPRHLSI